jgi:predicted nucleic-acid-binding Zn-ribbon protein
LGRKRIKSGFCPKCGSTEVKIFTNRSTTLGSMARVYVDDYCCMNCGYTETYTQNLSLKKIQQIETKEKKGESL